MANGDDGNGRRLDAAVNGLVATMLARGLQYFGFPLIVGLLLWMGHMLSDGHDRLLRIDQNFMDWKSDVDTRLNDHEGRIRHLEADRTQRN